MNVYSDERTPPSLRIERLGRALSFRHVEFLGVPGAGKSSLTPAAIDEIRQAEIGAADLDEAVYLALRAGMQDRLFGPVIRHAPGFFGRKYFKHFAARSQDRLLALRGFLLEHPNTVVAILEALDSRRDVDPRQDLALGWIVELLWKYQLATESGASPPVLVLDEGFSNRAVTLFGYGFSEEDDPVLARYIAAIPKPDLVIVVSKDPESAVEHSRGWLRFDHLSYNEIVQYTRDAGDCIGATSRLLVEHGVDVREVRNNSSLDVASIEVRRIIRDWLDLG